MIEISHLSTGEQEFLQRYLPQAQANATTRGTKNEACPEKNLEKGSSQRPFVTLTYACSLDSMISLGPSLRTTLSGPQSKSMTHFLRLHHDAILVGVGTAIADDPSLTCRYPGVTFESQPQPVVLDPHLRWDVANASVRQLATDGKGKTLWHLHDEPDAPRAASMPGCERIPIRHGREPSTFAAVPSATAGASGRLDWSRILSILGGKGIRSVMIEGGATIINDLLSRPDLVDSVIITIAPTFLGEGGVVVSPKPRTEDGSRVNAASLDLPVWKTFGQDVVLCSKLSP